MLENTSLFTPSEIENAVINEVLEEVYYALKQKGYNPINQLVGYLTTGDASYISSYQNARNKILGIDRAKILQVLLESYIEK